MEPSFIETLADNRLQIHFPAEPDLSGFPTVVLKVPEHAFFSSYKTIKLPGVSFA